MFGRPAEEPITDSHLRQRLEMVKQQIARRGVHDPRVLKAMENVPRHAFVPEAIRHRAYEDGALSIACGQTISQPFVVATMVAALKLRAGARVLEVGAGSGYAAAVLAEVAAEVYAIERFEELAIQARGTLERTGYGGVELRCGDGTLGWPEHAPYDGILVSAGAPDVPPSLEAQLAVGGSLVLPVGPSRLDQALVRVTRREDGTMTRTRLSGVRFVPLVGAEGWASDDDAGGW